MKKSAYLFFGTILLLLLLPFLTGWVYPEIQHILHTQNEQVRKSLLLSNSICLRSTPTPPQRSPASITAITQGTIMWKCRIHGAANSTSLFSSILKESVWSKFPTITVLTHKKS